MDVSKEFTTDREKQSFCLSKLKNYVFPLQIPKLPAIRSPIHKTRKINLKRKKPLNSSNVPNSRRPARYLAGIQRITSHIESEQFGKIDWRSTLNLNETSERFGDSSSPSKTLEPCASPPSSTESGEGVLNT